MWVRALPVAFLMFTAGCMVSEQVGDFNTDLTFHFASDVNRYLLFGRSAGLGIIAFWIFSAEKKSPKKVVSVLLGLPALGVAGYLLYRDYPALKSYRIELLSSGLYIRVPPEPEIHVDWNSIERMEIKGVDYGRGIRSPNPLSQTSYFTDLPDWQDMTLTLTNKETYHVDLSRLSVEQRQILWRGIAKRAQLVEEK
jgi:hypothetical protein